MACPGAQGDRMTKRQRRNRAAKALAVTRWFWMPDLESEARRLEADLARKLGGAALTVRVERGHLVVYNPGPQWAKKAPAPQRRLRLTPINTAIYRLSYFRHTGRWWPLSCTGTIKELAAIVASHLEPLLELA